MMEIDPDVRDKMVKIFGRFALKEVQMIETKHTRRIGGEDYEISDVRPADDNHPVLRDLRATAKKCGVALRIHWPGMIATMEFNRDRLNVHIEKGSDGKWRISERMNLDASPAIIRTMTEVIEQGLDNDLKVRKPFQFKKAPVP